jgi:hypothetical protein
VNGLPSSDLELRAAEQRRRLQSSVERLRARLEYDFDLRRLVRRNLGLASAGAILVGLLSGYWITGAFLGSGTASGGVWPLSRKRLIPRYLR